MGSFKSAVLTAKGQELMAKVVAGTCTLDFTKIATSEQDYSKQADLSTLTGIGTIKQSALVASVERLNTSNVKVSTSFSNINLTQGYYARTIGLYATDPQAGEILYSVSIADESTAKADYMPPYNGIGVSSLMVDLITVVSNASSVNVVVDPTALATVAQVVDLQEQVTDLRNYVGYNMEGIYGVEVDYVNRKFTRIAGAEGLQAGDDFSSIEPWNRRRCIITDEGVVLAYRGDSGYNEAGATTQAITVGETEYPAGTLVQVMVEQPVFYYKVVPIVSKKATAGRGKQISKARYYISPTPLTGFSVLDAFKDDNGNVQDKIYLSAYEGSVFDVSESAYCMDDTLVSDFTASTGDKLSSIAGAKPASGLSQVLTRANARILSTNRGAGWKLHNVFALNATQLLSMIEFASMDLQSKVGKGVSEFTDDGKTNMAIVTGGTSILGNTSGMADGTNGQVSVSYRGEENLWGNIWTWLDGLNYLPADDGGVVYVKGYGEMKDNTNSDGYTALDTGIARGEGYISAFGANSECDSLFIPSEHYGNSSLPVGDYMWNYNSGWRVAILGGRWSYGSTCGAWCLHVDDDSSRRYRSIGGRLLYVPQTKIS